MKPGSLYHEMSRAAVAAKEGTVEGMQCRRIGLGYRPGENMLYSPHLPDEA